MLLAACTEKVHADTIPDDAACHHTWATCTVPIFLHIWYLPAHCNSHWSWKKDENSFSTQTAPVLHALASI